VQREEVQVEREVMMFLCGMLSFGMIGGFGLAGFRMWLKARSDRRGEIEPGDLRRLTDAMESMHAQLHQVSESMAELHERVDFTERMLTRGEDRPLARQDTPV
jgi:hypothetical protein